MDEYPFRKGRFVVTRCYNPSPATPSPPSRPPPPLRSLQPGGIYTPAPPFWPPPRPPPPRTPSSARPPCPPAHQQPSSVLPPNHPWNTDIELALAPPVRQTPPAADAPRFPKKRRNWPEKKEQNLALPVTKTSLDADTRGYTRRGTEAVGRGVDREKSPRTTPNHNINPIRRSSRPPQQMAFSFSTHQPQQQQPPSIFQTPQPPQLQQPSIFQTPQPPQLQQPSIFQTPQPQQQQQPSIFQTPQPQQQQQFSPFPSFGQQPQQQNVQFQQQQAAAMPSQQLLLFTVDRSPASYNTKWEDLHPDSQKLLLQIEERILEYKYESQRLDQCSRLYDSSVSSDSFELDASRILQELGGITTAIEREKVSVQELMKNVNDLMWHTEFAVRSYIMLRPRFLRQNVPAASGVGPASQTVSVAVTPGQTNQLMTSSISPSFDFYSGIPKRPSLFMHHTAARFEKYLTECCQWIEELEQLLLMDTDKTSSNSLEALPKVMSNVHDYFIHVAAKVESLHQYIESMKMAYLADQRRRGDGNDPFIEANRREAAKQEAAARRVHPTLHLPANSAQPATQAAGIFASSTGSISRAPQLSSGTTASSSGGFSTFSAPPAPSTSASSSFLFSTPTSSVPSSTLFGSSGFTPQSTPFGTASTPLFGSTQTPSGFGTSTPSFASTPALGSSSLFGTPSLGTGTTTGSGASFGAASKSSRPKSRTTRR